MSILSNNFYYQPLKIDSVNTQVYGDFIAKEGDANGRGLLVTLTENGLLKDTTGITLNLKWAHTTVAGVQGLDPFESIDLTKGLYKVTYPTNMLRKGKVDAFIQIIDSGSVIGSRNIKINVEATVGDDTAIESSNEFRALASALVEVQSWNARIDDVEQEFIDKANNLDATYPIELNSVKSQLAETSAELNARVSQTIATAGDGTIPSELTDMRVRNDGTMFTAAGDYVRHLENVLGVESALVQTPAAPVLDYYDVPVLDAVSSASTYRAWGMRLKPLAITVNVIKIKLGLSRISAGASLYVEFQDIRNGNIMAKGSALLSTSNNYVFVPLNRDVSLSNGITIVATQILDGKAIVMPVIRSTEKDPNIDTSLDVGVYYNTSEIIGDTINGGTASHTGLVYQLFYANENELKRVVGNVAPPEMPTITNVHTVAKSGAMHTTIQAAVNAANEFDTVLIYPGEYHEAVSTFNKQLNIIGVSKENCIIYNDTSAYSTPPLEISCGMVKGLTLIEDHSNPDPLIANESVYEWERAYTIHIDHSYATGKKLIIDDCILKNSKRHTFGIGLFQDNEIVIQNCDIWTGAATRTGLDTAGVYFHNQLIAQDVTNQKIRLINNTVYSDDNFALRIQDVTSPGYVSALECEFINNMFYSKLRGKLCVKGGFTTNITLAPTSYGNNIDMLNA